MMFYQVTTIFIEKKQRNRAIFKRIMNQPQIVLSRWVFSLHCRNQRIMPHTNTSTVNYTFSIHLFFKTFEYFKNILNCANSMDEKWNEHWRYSCLKRYAFQSICYETSVKKIFKLITDFRLDLNVSFGRFHALNTKIVNFL